MTGREWVSASLRLLGVIAPGESLDASEATDGLGSLNRMIDSWSNEGLLIHARVRETPFTLTVSDATVTVGASGNITTRPIEIEYATIQDASTGIETKPLKQLTEFEYAAIPLKTQESTYPYAFWDDGAYPQRVLTLWPVPSAAHKLVLYTRRALTSITDLNTDISLPQGYEEALVYNGAIRLAPEYGKAAPAEVVKIAADSLSAIMTTNSKPAMLENELSNGGSFDIYTGGYR